jgi:hypothetical protein
MVTTGQSLAKQMDTNNVVEVFKTSIGNQQESILVSNVLRVMYPAAKINFDLEDCDNVLRIENSSIPIEEVTKMLKALGYQCEVLV